MQTKINNNSTNYRTSNAGINQSDDDTSNKTENNFSSTTIDTVAEESFFKKIGTRLDKICSRVMGIEI